MIKFGEYAPDQPALDSGGMFSTVAKNTVPLTKTSYGPVAALAASSDALTARCQGAASFRDKAGNAYTFAGDSSKLYSLTTAAWGNVSIAAGYTTDDHETVELAKFGERIVSANGINDPIQSYTMGASSLFANLASAAPRARHIAQIKDFIMVLNTWDSTDGAKPSRLWWSAIDDPTDWPTVGSADAAQKQSDYQDLPSGGWGQALIGAVGGVDGAAFMDTAIYRIVYSGSPAIFSFHEVERERGTAAPNSVINIGDFAAYLGQEGFYIFNGQDSTPIGDQRVDKTFLADLNQSLFHLVIGAADVLNKRFWWIYPSTGNSVPNKAIVYNWAIDRWSHAEFDSEFIFRDHAQGETLETLDTNYGTNIDSASVYGFSFDSRVYTGGRPLLGFFDNTHKLAAQTGAALAAVIESQEIGGKSRIFVSGVQPYIDADDTDDITIKLKYRDTPGTTVTTGSAASIDSDGSAHFTQSARYVRAEVTVAASASWNHAQGVDADVSEDGGV